MRIGSLCTGTSALDMAVQSVLGGELAWVADPDPGAAALLAYRHPAVPNLGDITTTGWAQVRTVDIITAGYPCQPFSVAGNREGTEDDRHIWPHVAEAVRRVRPVHVFLENVPGHLSLGFGRVVADLASLGYVGSWRCVRASDVGAAHRRERVFILAHLADAKGDRYGNAGAPLLGGMATPAVTGGSPAGDAADPTGLGRNARRTEPARQQRRPDVAVRCGSAPSDSAGEGWEARREGLPGTGGPAADAEGLGHEDRAQRYHRQLIVAEHRPGAGDRSRAGAPRTGGTGGDSGFLGWGQFGPAIDQWAGVLGRPAPDPTESAPRGGRRLSPRFVEWLMGLPDGWITGVPGLTRNQMLKLGGNGVVPQQGACALSLLLSQLDLAVAA